MSNELYQWKCQPKAETFILNVLNETIQKNEFVMELSQDLHRHTSTRLFDWLDHIIVGHTQNIVEELERLGFESETVSPTYRVYRHPGAQLPRVVVTDQEQSTKGIAVSVESIADFLMVRGLSRHIEGSPYSGYRRCCVSPDSHAACFVIERRGSIGMEPVHTGPEHIEKYIAAKEKWKTRPRSMFDHSEAFSRTIQLAQQMVDMVGEEMAAWIVLECEREYWQSRNTAGQIQKNRQDRLGMGWANHDHHTFRSSRRFFSQLVRLFEILGFHCRERYYTGKEAGWGAQIMENPKCKLVLFLDVDLAPDELEIDFAHHELTELDSLGTIGLWCELHGDSILKAGMHHLEAQFMFDDLAKDLKGHGITMMDPFSSFPYLKQAFTHGEIWPVDRKKIETLLEARKIKPEHAEKFIHYGAIGSHLENLQRREGYKGFNQKNVSVIIKKTDPRK